MSHPIIMKATGVIILLKKAQQVPTNSQRRNFPHLKLRLFVPMQVSTHAQGCLKTRCCSLLILIAHLHHPGCYSPRALGSRRVTDTWNSSTVSDYPSQSQTFFWIDNQEEEDRGARLPKMDLLLAFFNVQSLTQPAGCSQSGVQGACIKSVIPGQQVMFSFIQ